MSPTEVSAGKRGSIYGRILFVVLVAVVAAGYWQLYVLNSQEEPREPIDTSSAPRLQALEDLMLDGPRAIPVLIEQLESADPVERQLAALGLSRLGPDAKEAVPTLARLIDDESPRVRAHALLALGKINSDLDTLTSSVAARLCDEDLDVRRNAAHALVVAGAAAAPAALASLEQRCPRGIPEALTVLRHVATDADATQAALRALLADPALDQSVHDEIVEMLLAIGDVTNDEILRGLATSGLRSTSLALQAVRSRPGDFRQFLPSISRDLSRVGGRGPAQFDDRQKDILATLREMGMEARDATLDLRGHLESGRFRDVSCLLLIRTLARIGADKSEYVPALVRLFVEADVNPMTGMLVLPSLGDVLRELAPDEIPSLAERLAPQLESEDYGVRSRAYAQFLSLGPAGSAAVPKAIAQLHRGSFADRRKALELLEAIGPGATDAISALEQLVKTPANTVDEAKFVGIGTRVLQKIQSRPEERGPGEKHSVVELPLFANSEDVPQQNPYSTLYSDSAFVSPIFREFHRTRIGRVHIFGEDLQSQHLRNGEDLQSVLRRHQPQVRPLRRSRNENH